MHSVIGYYSSLQAVVEVGLGSFLHAFHIPFSGHVLSLNQALILSVACRKINSRHEAIGAANGISVVVAILKSLSPIGKRLTPMLAISVQGFLFSIGIFIFGSSLPGVLLGSALLALWSFTQPLLFAYLVFGETLFLAAEKIWLEVCSKLQMTPELGPMVLISFVSVKIIFGLCVAGIGWKFSSAVSEKYFSKITKFGARSPLQLKAYSQSTAITGAIRDLMQPWMLFSFFISALFLIVSQQSGFTDVMFYVLRVIAVSLLSFWFVRAFPQSWTHKFLNYFPSIKHAVHSAFPTTEQKK